MALCARHYVLRSLTPRCYLASRRQLTTLRAADQTRLSYFLPHDDIPRSGDILTKLSGNAAAALKNPQGHNAAVVLATPDLAKQLDDQEFTSGLVNLLSASGGTGDFHLLCAVVDSIAPALGDVTPLQGISILRGHVDTLLPQLWHPDPPREAADKDAVAALTFSMGMSTLTLPLTRTTFQNHRTSTLLSSRYNFSQGQPQLQDSKESRWQHIHIAFDEPARSIAQLGLWAPLSPVTRARKITESFGNIVRGIEIDGKSSPASTELEDSVNTMFEHRKAHDNIQGPMGVWAMVSPEASEADSQAAALEAPGSEAILEGKIMQGKDVESASNYLQQQHQLGSRFYQVLSGGGGWGPKKGLLSLDPQQTHFALSEEQEMENFMRTMDNSGFAPPGAHIQFFIPAVASPEATTCSVAGIVFGVPSGTHTSAEAETASKGYLVVDHFGALSSQGVYLSGRAAAGSASCYESKLNIPGCRIFVGNSEAKARGFFKLLGAGGLADAGTIALM